MAPTLEYRGTRFRVISAMAQLKMSKRKEEKMKNLIDITSPKTVKILLSVCLALYLCACTRQGKEKSVSNKVKHIENTQQNKPIQNTTFPQIHTNLNGMVREFVRRIHQDTKGNYWFGTNGDGIIRYNSKVLEKIKIEGINPFFRVLAIEEDKAGNIWFGTSEGLIKYDSSGFTTFSENDGFRNQEIWGLMIDRNGLIWLGGTEGVIQFDGVQFMPFAMPDFTVINSKPMLSPKLVFKIIEDSKGTIWFVTDGNGIIKYRNGQFTHLTNENNHIDNNTADILEDRKGNIWLGSFYSGLIKFDGKTYTRFTEDGTIVGEEIYNLFEDNRGNIWFTAEGHGVYRYNEVGFKQFTTENGLTSLVTQSIYEDRKGQIWFGSWQGLCIFDGEKFVDARQKETWTN